MLLALSHIIAQTYVLAALQVCPASSIVPSFTLDENTLPTQIVQSLPPDSVAVESRQATFFFSFPNHTFDMNYQKIAIPGTNLSCAFVEGVKLHLNVQPVIYINKKYVPGGCAYDALKKKYEKRVSDIMSAVRDYQPKMQADALSPVAALPPPTPLTPVDMLQQVQAMRNVVEKAVEGTFHGMMEYLKQREAQLEEQSQSQPLPACGN